MLAEYISIIKIEGMLSKYECIRYNDIMLSQFIFILCQSLVLGSMWFQILAEYVSIVLKKYECIRYKDIMLSQFVIIVSK